MEIQHEMFQKSVLEKDIVYTPEHISVKIIKWLNPLGKCLDPCRGDGSFWKHLPEGSGYCEIREGKDFFDYCEKVDWIIGNPPYSIFEDFLIKSFEISDNVSFLVPTNKIFQRQIIMELINNFGGIKSILVFGSGQLLDFPFGFSVANFHFEKKYNGPTQILLGLKSISEKYRNGFEG